MSRNQKASTVQGGLARAHPLCMIPMYPSKNIFFWPQPQTTTRPPTTRNHHDEDHDEVRKNGIMYARISCEVLHIAVIVL